MQLGALFPNMDSCYKQRLYNIQALSDINKMKLEYARVFSKDLINI